MPRMWRSRRLYLGVLAAWWCTIGVARGGTPRDQVDRLIQPLIDEGWIHGVAVAVVTADGTHVYGYGRISDANRNPPAGDTVFEIGSVTKPFTGALLAQMVESGEVTLDDPVEKYLPDDATPRRKGRPITLRHLATHHSGLTRLQDNLNAKDRKNPYADHTAEQLYAFLRGNKPPAAPGERFAYSNLGMGLLGHALARRAGTTYEQAIVERIAKPLGMNDTCIVLRDDLRARLAPAHDPEGRPASNWDFADVMAACGGIRSTPNDMARFVAANVGLIDTPLKDALAESHTRLAKVDGDNDIGLGWHVRHERNIVWHNGQVGGYHAFVAFVPERRVGVVLLDNYSFGLIDPLGLMLIRQLLGDDVQPMKLPREVKLDPARLDDFVGDYAISPIFFLRVARDGDRLSAQASLQPALRIYPQGDDSFFYKAILATLTFERDEVGQVIAATLDQDGAKRRAPRIK